MLEMDEVLIIEEALEKSLLSEFLAMLLRLEKMDSLEALEAVAEVDIVVVILCIGACSRFGEVVVTV